MPHEFEIVKRMSLFHTSTGKYDTICTLGQASISKRMNVLFGVKYGNGKSWNNLYARNID